MAEDTNMDDPAPPCRRLIPDELMANVAEAIGTTSEFDCPRCLRPANIEHPKNFAAACTQLAYGLCDKSSHRGAICPAIKLYPGIFTVAYLKEHIPEAFVPNLRSLAVSPAWDRHLHRLRNRSRAGVDQSSERAQPERTDWTARIPREELVAARITVGSIARVPSKVPTAQFPEVCKPTEYGLHQIAGPGPLG